MGEVIDTMRRATPARLRTAAFSTRAARRLPATQRCMSSDRLRQHSARNCRCLRHSATVSHCNPGA
ncbi:hypothetical protein XbrCFBP1976_09980 [Xanthomonas bromi]|uniref:Uncharacterized protein n=1 Tax=Xanthomonas bromi TaxID=56449 RepID=A0ABX5BPU0_9XANT|nr:hypothetical protein XbrCFBP1976_09980 [Xanthomonas bromi]